MARNRACVVETERLPLSDGDWIEVKRDLNYGESKKWEMAGAMAPVQDANGHILTPIDLERCELERVAVYLLDWSFRGADDKVLPLKTVVGGVNLDTLRALNPEDFQEVYNAILTHRAARRAAKNRQREEERKSQPQPALDAEATSLS